ncbi:MAG: bifunctional 4-hydroxy-2-oxoglutarate aldolase/2-dehydro-3-deoxy-phosphogluconate aldolase [Hyphomicrobiales bacterium]|nr:bifunctional 4-hydroxy-2-oxoglutarate aldolase/2-dehydro-3-deoxy-phosphogluconate aldolase [Hyphomicrobiales bacterium]
MHRAPVIPVLTIDDVEGGVELARTLVSAGLMVLEITLRTPVALAAIKAMAAAVPGAIVGAGTIVEASQIEASIKAGATFLVSPGMTPGLMGAALAAPVPFLPGVATASEAMHLREHGFRALKFFPAESAGGAGALSSLAGPLADLSFCPTGGIDAARAPTYLALGNVECVGGSWMVPKAALANRDYATIHALAAAAARLGRP